MGDGRHFQGQNEWTGARDSRVSVWAPFVNCLVTGWIDEL